jgi:hypothetical protein
MEEWRRTAENVTGSEVHAVANEAGVVNEVAEVQVSQCWVGYNSVVY